MADSANALALREPSPVPAQAPAETPIEDVLFPELPPGIAEALKDQPKRGTNAQLTAGRIAKARLRANLLFSLKTQGYSYGEIAELTGLTTNSVKKALVRARRAGRLHDARMILENDSTMLAVESVNHHLREKDKQMTIAHLKGMGHYRNYSNNKHEGGAAFTMPPLHVNVTVQTGPAPTPDIIDVSDGAIGVPRTDD